MRIPMVCMLAVVSLSGCASALGIGEADFSCKAHEAEPGYRCKPAREVYELTHPNNRNSEKRADAEQAAEAASAAAAPWYKRMMGKLSKGDAATGDMPANRNRSRTVVEQDLAVIRTNPEFIHQSEVPHIESAVRRYSKVHDKNFQGGENELFEVIPTTTQAMIPIRTPPRVMRVMITSYESSEGVLHSGGYSFVEIEERRWQIGTPAPSRGDGRVRSMEQVLTDNAQTIDKPASSDINLGPVNIGEAQQQFPPRLNTNDDRDPSAAPVLRERLTPEEREQQRLDYYQQQQNSAQ